MADPPPRLIALDLLRGVAVMGILLMNITGFALPMAAYTNPAAAGGTDPLGGLQGVRGPRHQRVAGLVTFAVVDLLEAVEVDHRHAHQVPERVDALLGVGHQQIPAGPVEQSGQGVPQGQGLGDLDLAALDPPDLVTVALLAAHAGDPGTALAVLDALPEDVGELADQVSALRGALPGRVHVAPQD